MSATLLKQFETLDLHPVLPAAYGAGSYQSRKTQYARRFAPLLPASSCTKSADETRTVDAVIAIRIKSHVPLPVASRVSLLSCQLPMIISGPTRSESQVAYVTDRATRGWPVPAYLATTQP